MTEKLKLQIWKSKYYYECFWFETLNVNFAIQKESKINFAMVQIHYQFSMIKFSLWFSTKNIAYYEYVIFYVHYIF